MCVALPGEEVGSCLVVVPPDEQVLVGSATGSGSRLSQLARLALPEYQIGPFPPGTHSIELYLVVVECGSGSGSGSG